MNKPVDYGMIYRAALEKPAETVKVDIGDVKAARKSAMSVSLAWIYGTEG